MNATVLTDRKLVIEQISTRAGACISAAGNEGLGHETE